MIPFFHAKTVFLGTNLKEFNEMREFLKQHHVKYQYKINSQSGRWIGGGTVRGIQGSIGISPERNKMYEIRIHEKDAKRLGL